MLATTHEMLQNACKGHYAVPAINTQGGAYDIVRAVCMAAEELRSPVILAYYVDTGAYSGHGWFHGTTKWMAAKVSVPVAARLDHEDGFRRCMGVLKLGSTSIMFDSSILPVEGNTAATEAVARVRRSFGVPLGAEVGELCHLDDEGNKMDASSIADPDTVRQYLKPCHPGPLAIDIGNAHGSYNGPADIRAEMLEEHRKFTDIPFVLHGCAGTDGELVKCSIDSGITEINFGTQVRCQYVNYLKEGLAEGKDQGHTWRLSQYAELRLREDIKDIIRLAGSQRKT